VAQSEELLPPKGLIVDGHRTIFTESGRALFEYFREHGDLKPNEHVLDVGCGAGRLAVPLTGYLSAEGGYEGFDISQPRIEWLTEAVTSRFPNFGFTHADLYNRTYNWKAKTRPSDYRFPYDDDRFDFAIAMSLFTHMLPGDIDHYFAEIARVLRPGARWVGSFFLINDESLRLLDETKESRRDPAFSAVDALFSHDHGNYRVSNPELPETVVALDEDYVLTLYEQSGFEVRQPIHYGRWPGRDSTVPGGQDLIFANRV
jgi:SAM-dependent methyltransferase